MVRDRDYIRDHHGLIFKVIGDQHPESHYLGYVKYYPDRNGDRVIDGMRYRQNSVVSKSFGILADRPDYYIYSDALGCVITAVPRERIDMHYCARTAAAEIVRSPGRLPDLPAGRDLLAILHSLTGKDKTTHFGVTGSFLVGCANKRSDIDLVCYGQEGQSAAERLFQRRDLIHRYSGENLHRLYTRRAKYMEGSGFSTLIRQEQRKLQGLTAGAEAHINCEPLRSDCMATTRRLCAKEVGDIEVLATVTDHGEGCFTPALYGIRVQQVIRASVDEPEEFARRITYMRSYLGAYTNAFQTGDTLYAQGRIVHLSEGADSTFGVELTPWSVSRSFIANVTGSVIPASDGPLKP
jgi:predicted nucleotidyltransferase